ncbi:MAG TPA: methyltransferase domain-containing protein [Anaerolineales bacterium]|nr:methyltransferase domain-containing protein [Anaerolineales bacterium]
MPESLSFDRAADFYDQTRSLLEPIARQGTEAILDLTGHSARILDVGTGTGRISVPLLERGADLVGCDISSKMLSRLREKFPSARILQSDASRLPFPNDRFDAVLTVHVMHLIAPWRAALREFQRVLSHGGIYLNVRTYASVGESLREQVRTYWRGWVEAQGGHIHQPGIRDHEEFLQELRSLGTNLTEREVVRFTLPFTLREELDRFASRIYSDTWDIPDDIFDASLEELRVWVERQFGDLDQQRQDEVRFVIDAARFDG